MKVQRDSLYLFLCHMEWRKTRNLDAYTDLVAALDDADPNIRQLAESLLRRSSPRPIQRCTNPLMKKQWPHQLAGIDR